MFAKEYKVLVLCCTYNQKPYIKETLYGFSKQHTDFPFVCLVIDDYSIDGEQDEIKAFLEIECDMSHSQHINMEDAHVCIAQHKKNPNCFFAVYFLTRNLYKTPRKEQIINEWRKNCEYEALCEGDDYWIDSLKLQKQVDFLNSNPEYSMCFHRAKVLAENMSTIWLNSFSIQDRDYTATEVIDDWIVPTASVVYRKEVLSYPVVNPSRILNGDIILVERCAHCGRIRGFSEFMSIYRICTSGLTYNYSNYVNRKMRSPAHFECIRDSFPKIDPHTINVKIAESYFKRIRFQKNIKDKFSDWKKSYKSNRGICLSFTAKRWAFLVFQRIKKLLRVN